MEGIKKFDLEILYSIKIFWGEEILRKKTRGVGKTNEILRYGNSLKEFNQKVYTT